MAASTKSLRYYCVHCERDLKNQIEASGLHDTVSGDEELRTGDVVLIHDQCGHKVAFSGRDVAGG